MSLQTRVFELAEREGYTSQNQLARAMGVDPATISRVRNGKDGIGTDFIVGALSAFPGKTFDDLFFVVRDQVRQAEPAA